MKYILLITIFLSMQGCTIKEAPMKVYTLNIHTDIKAYSYKYKDKIIKVSYPQSLKEKIGQNMQFSYNDVEQGNYQNAQWSNTLGQLLQGIFIQTLQQSGLFEGVTSYNSIAQEDYRLESTVFDFSHRVRGSTSDAIVSVQFSLIDTNSGKMVKNKLFSYVVPTVSTDSKGYADATNVALAKLSKDLIAWLAM
ncbi:MAG: ABC-type transport auxiliary lipoprotein family protein [Sulfurovaceae bacterium]|nr:ABC-type transport auxiliary lipoprotein family protein [Sulfurovaceae bacterium]